MAHQLPNQKGFLIIEMDWKDCVNITDTWGLSDCCGQNTSEEKLYYIAVLDQYYCKPCYDAWLSGATRYKPDLEAEIPECIIDKGEINTKGEKDSDLYIDTFGYITVLTEAIQELNAKVETLEARIEELEGKKEEEIEK